MAAEIFDFEIEQGSTFKWDIYIKDPAAPTQPMDISGCTFASMARVKFADAQEAFEFTCTTIDDPTGHVQLSLTDEETALISKGSYYYDVEITNGAGETYKLYKGRITVSAEATK